MIEMIIISISDIICFILGVSVRQKVDNKVDIKLPSISKTIKNHTLEKEQRIKQSQNDTILDNINNYPNNQQEVR